MASADSCLQNAIITVDPATMRTPPTITGQVTCALQTDRSNPL
jgi:hypothetical protein